MKWLRSEKEPQCMWLYPAHCRRLLSPHFRTLSGILRCSPRRTILILKVSICNGLCVYRLCELRAAGAIHYTSLSNYSSSPQFEIIRYATAETSRCDSGGHCADRGVPLLSADVASRLDSWRTFSPYLRPTTDFKHRSQMCLEIQGDAWWYMARGFSTFRRRPNGSINHLVSRLKLLCIISYHSNSTQ